MFVHGFVPVFFHVPVPVLVPVLVTVFPQLGGVVGPGTLPPLPSDHVNVGVFPFGVDGALCPLVGVDPH